LHWKNKRTTFVAQCMP